MKKNRKHYSITQMIWIVVKYVSLVFFSLVSLLPIISCVITAFKTKQEYQSTNVMTLPESWLNFSFCRGIQHYPSMGGAFRQLRDHLYSAYCAGSIIISTDLPMY